MTTRSTSADRLAGIAQIITATAEVLGHEITPAAVEMMALDLAEYPDQQIALALQACRRELTGRLTLAAILERIAVLDGHPEPNEAWAIALRASDETASAAMTAEIATALHASSPVLAAGDEVGARMAFIDSYKRCLMESRRERKPVRWYLSPGHCPHGRLSEIERMKREGMIGETEKTQLIEQHTQQALLTSPEVGAVVALITGKPASQSLTNAEQIERARMLREQVEKQNQKTLQQQEETRQQERARHEQLLKRHAEALAILEGH
ncbi:MAG: hypothetical protein GXZ05_09665 [Gammaproteobacteria bacterium]|nr:hypothetical protein [Gammaproteobacteria bacterium]